MRGVDGGEGSYVRRSATGCYGITAVQTAFGVGDDVHFFTAGLLYDVPDACGKFLSAVRYRSCGLLTAVIEDGTVLLQGEGNPALVIKEAKIPEKHAMYQQKRIPGPAEPALGPDLI